MPITQITDSARRVLSRLLLASLTACPLAAMPAGVAVLHAAAWSPGDTVREGAGEFEVLMCAARLQHDHAAAGIVGVGDRHGLFLEGTERALRLLALRGVPVAKLTLGGDLAADPEGLFIDASGLPEATASALLTRCLERLGAPPAAADPEHPTTGEIAAIRTHLKPFREAFALASTPRLAAR